MKVVARQEFKLDSAVQRLNHYSTRTSPHQNWLRKLLSPFIFVASLQPTVFTPSRLTDNSFKIESSTSFHLVSVRGTSISAGSKPAQVSKPRFFFLFIFYYNGCFGLAVRRLSAHLFIYSFIYSISIFNEPFNYVKQVLPLFIKANQRLRAMEWYSTFLKAPRLEPHLQIV